LYCLLESTASNNCWTVHVGGLGRGGGGGGGAAGER